MAFEIIENLIARKLHSAASGIKQLEKWDGLRGLAEGHNYAENGMVNPGVESCKSIFFGVDGLEGVGPFSQLKLVQAEGHKNRRHRVIADIARHREKQ